MNVNVFSMTKLLIYLERYKSEIRNAFFCDDKKFFQCIFFYVIC